MLTDYSEVIPHLYLTNWSASNDINKLFTYNIRAVLTIEQHDKPTNFKEFAVLNNIQTMHIVLDDLPEEKISKYFDSSYEFINNAINDKKNVLVHCWAGISRSVTLVLNFLLRKLYEINFTTITDIPKPEVAISNCIQLIKINRPFVNPNKGFLLQLYTKVNEYYNAAVEKLNHLNQKIQENVESYENKNTKKTDLNYSFDIAKMADCTAFVTSDNKPGNVICLTNSDFDQQGNLINFPNVSGPVMFYADWCGHCKHMKPNFANFSNMVKGTNMRAFAVNADKNKDLLDRIKLDSFGYSVRGFPTVAGYSNGKFYSMYAPDKQSKNPFRSAEDILDYSKGLGTATIDWE
jgi:thiol-disulfide isomerase/thioredoxin